MPRPAIAALVLWLSCLSWAGPRPAGAQPLAFESEPRTITEIVDGDTLILADGRQVRLVGIQAPKLPLGRPNFRAWPLATQSKAALEAITLGRAVRLGYGGMRIDRYGRALAQLYLADGTWIQGALIEQGLARVYSFADNRALVAELLALEGRARAQRRGIWADPFYDIRTPEESAGDIASFQLVEGRVVKAVRVRNLVFLNFGEDWKRDFTIRIETAARRLFEAEAIDLLGFEGRRLRVRGWLKSWNGPMIEVTHPEQIELLEE